jgi:hypothetical protein
MVGQQSTARNTAVVDDWTRHHVVFSNPGTALEAMSRGEYSRWYKIVNDPRFALQQAKRNAALTATQLPPGSATPETASPDSAADEWRPGRDEHGRRRRGPMSGDLHPDWSMNMGSGAAAGLGVFPAKYSLGVTTVNCGNSTNPDFVVFNTGLAGSATQASITAYDNLYTGCAGTVPSVYWAYNTNGGTVVTSVVLSLDGSQVAFAQSSSAGVASLAVLKWAASSLQSPSSPANLTPVSTSAYRNCTAPCMASLTFAGGANDSGSSPFYDYVSDALYVGDDSGNLHKFTGVFNGTPAEATSPWPLAISLSALDGPIYDSVSGNIFVGDYLPPSASSTCAPSGSPCGFLYAVRASSGSIVGTSNRLDYVNGIVSSPLVDSSAGMLYVFVGADGQSGVTSSCGTDIPCSGVFQFPVDFTSGSGTEVTVGPGYGFLSSGTFDNTYYTSGSPSSPSGHIYVVGSTGANNTLYEITIISNVIKTTATTGPTLSNNYTNGYYASGLPVTEFSNGGHDYIFVSVLSFGVPTNCNDSLSNGCVMTFDVTSGSISGSTAPVGAAAEAGGTSGIIVDNASTFGGGSNIYFTPLADQLCTTSDTTGGCAIQLSQTMAPTPLAIHPIQSAPQDN